MAVTPHPPLLLAPGRHEFPSYLCGFAPDGHFADMESHTLCLLCLVSTPHVFGSQAVAGVGRLFLLKTE